MSTEDIRKGDRWRNEIAAKLAETSFGILCLTPETLDSRWILFEAGTLSKHAKDSRVTALLIDLESNNVVEPLSQFQHTTATKDDIRRLVQQLNASLPDGRRLDADRLSRSFDVH
jgi:hypothetical protein